MCLKDAREEQNECRSEEVVFKRVANVVSVLDRNKNAFGDTRQISSVTLLDKRTDLVSGVNVKYIDEEGWTSDYDDLTSE